MDNFLRMSIREIIKTHPETERILADYDIDCESCTARNCLLGDIADIHNLSVENERALMERITEVISPGSEINISLRKRTLSKPNKISYSPPIEKLVEEHELIKRFVALIPFIIDEINISSQEIDRLIPDAVDFIGTFADRIHHTKEELILFKYFNEDIEIIRSMHEDHENARMHARAVKKAVGNRDRDKVISGLNGYRDVLVGHIKREDEILYPWMDNNLSASEKSDMFLKFNSEDKKDRSDIHKYETYISSLEEEFSVP